MLPKFFSAQNPMFIAFHQNRHRFVRFEIFTEVRMMMMMFFWVLAPCRLVGGCQYYFASKSFALFVKRLAMRILTRKCRIRQ
jgi:hypothetical protein